MIPLFTMYMYIYYICTFKCSNFLQKIPITGMTITPPPLRPLQSSWQYPLKMPIFCSVPLRAYMKWSFVLRFRGAVQKELTFLGGGGLG